MKDFELHNGDGPYVMLKHTPCKALLGYPKNLSDALKIMLGHSCPEDK
jgi:hypothetical protein